MEQENFSAQQSLDLITQVIREAKSKFEEDGVIYTMWGALLALAAGAQFYLLTNGYESINYYPYFLTPIGGLVSWWYYARKASPTIPGNHVSKISAALWIACSINIFIVSFALAAVLTSNLIPVILILLSIGLTVSGTIIKSPLFTFSGLFTNIAGIVCFFIDWLYHPLMIVAVSIIAVLIPGIIMMNRYRK